MNASPTAAAGQTAIALGRIFGRHKSLAHAATLAAMAESSAMILERGRNWYRNRLWTVTVTEGDRLYPDTHAWVLRLMPDEDHRALVATSVRGGLVASSDPVPDGDSQAAELLVVSNDRKLRTIDVDGHRVQVAVERAEQSANGDKGYREPASLVFHCHTRAAQKAVIRRLEQLVQDRAKTRPRLMIVNQWGSWNTRNDLPLRTMDSVILPTAQKTRIVDDLHRFLDAEHEYVRRGIPWHRGYMLHGPPGGGKTSLAKALAHEFNLNLWYVPLADLTKEASLINLLAQVEPRSLLLLEDIDAVRISQDRDDNEPGTISTSSLLNALDGVATPHGLITVMTTNRFDVLDAALTRAGRMDLIEQLEPPSLSEVSALYRYFFGRPMRHGIPFVQQGNVSQADVAEVLKRHMDDPDSAETALRDLLARPGATA